MAVRKRLIPYDKSAAFTRRSEALDRDARQWDIFYSADDTRPAVSKSAVPLLPALDTEDRLTGGDVLPGFLLPLAQVFLHQDQ